MNLGGGIPCAGVGENSGPANIARWAPRYVVAVMRNTLLFRAPKALSLFASPMPLPGPRDSDVSLENGGLFDVAR